MSGIASLQQPITPDRVQGNQSSTGQTQTLGQDAFLKLFTAQLANQDPTDPVKNEAFVAQLAQFSSVENLTAVNNKMDVLAGFSASNQALQATSLVGKHVLAPTKELTLENAGDDVSGQINIPSTATNLKIELVGENGVTVATQNTSRVETGEFKFTLDKKDQSQGGGDLASGNYKIKVTAIINGKSQALEAAVKQEVQSVTIDRNQGSILLNLPGGKTTGINQINKIS
ncbi:flagellar hook assembly protein FlgD [Pelagibaculum spongiae]|uniref:Basal-body rod modification protein FlgD n=1 Tax=Pelagibaculum spongiae TaxID=2080658 RepID=A0A2V1GXY1_9GAMM|nr:flagellar hook capping FlgD N-terminal domain-containing protein [Pelagibaculum spongiae]PVZ66745.1 hypothetical protein DC094_15880 [Pelagibaculum spongiae]